MKRIAILTLLAAAFATGGCGPGSASAHDSAPATAHGSTSTAAASPVQATAPATVRCRAQQIRGARYRVCEVPAGEVSRVQLMARETRGGRTAVRTIARAGELLRARGQRLLFAMNAGLYHEPDSATGMLVADSAFTYSRLNTSAGPPDPCSVASFYCPPNGVFFVAGGRAGLLSTADFAARPPSRIQLATQSGPMLVRNGTVTRPWTAAGTSLNVRNGVGVRADGTVVFAIADQPVNFHHFATAFRDELDTENALYMDGFVSRLYTGPGSEIPSQARPFAGIFVVSEPGTR